MGSCGFQVKNTVKEGPIGQERDPKQRICDCPKPPDNCNGGGEPPDIPYDCDFFGTFPSHFDTYDSIGTIDTGFLIIREPTKDADITPEGGCAGIGCSENVNFDLTSNFYGDCELCLEPPEGMTACEAARLDFQEKYVSASVACSFNNGYSCSSDLGICVDYTGYCPIDPTAEGAFRVVACCQDCDTVGCNLWGTAPNDQGTCYKTEVDAIDEALMLCPTVCDNASESIPGDLDFCSFIVSQDIFQTSLCSEDVGVDTIDNTWGFVCCCD